MSHILRHGARLTQGPTKHVRTHRKPGFLSSSICKGLSARSFSVSMRVNPPKKTQRQLEMEEKKQQEREMMGNQLEDDQPMKIKIDKHNHWADGTPFVLPERFKDTNWDRLARSLSVMEDKFFSHRNEFPIAEMNHLDLDDVSNMEKDSDAKATAVDIELANNAVEHQKFINTITHTAWLKTTGRRRQVAGAVTESYTTVVIGGNEKGAAGFGIGRGGDGFKSWENAVNNLRHNMINLEMHEGRTLYHPVSGKFQTSRVDIIPLPRGHGLESNSDLMKEICMCFGLEDVTSKIHGSRNPFNVVVAVWTALQQNTTWRETALQRGKNVYRMLEPRLYKPRYPTSQDMENQRNMVAKMLEATEKEWTDRKMARKMAARDYDERPENFDYFPHVPIPQVPQTPSVPPPM